MVKYSSDYICLKGHRMNRKEFRETMIKKIYSDIINPDQELLENESVLNEVFLGYKSHIDELDEIIQKSLVNWTIQRLNYVDLAIVRYAVYEYLYLNQPKEVVINEALELTKKYSNLDDDSARKFNNRLLQNIFDAIGDQDA